MMKEIGSVAKWQTLKKKVRMPMQTYIRHLMKLG
jgi:hypothetical protein